MTEWIGETFTSETGWDHLETLVDVGNRMAGSEGEREAAELTRDAIRDDSNAERAAATEGAVYVAGQIPNSVEYEPYTVEDGTVKARIDAPTYVLDRGVTADASTHSAVSFPQGCWTEDRDGEVVGPVGSPCIAKASASARRSERQTTLSTELADKQTIKRSSWKEGFLI
jgi:hypothetical protein